MAVSTLPTIHRDNGDPDVTCNCPLPLVSGGQLNPYTLRDTLKSIVCSSHTFLNNLGIKRRLTKYLKESCCLASDLHLSFTCFQENASVRKIFPKLPGLFWLLWVLMG